MLSINLIASYSSNKVTSKCSLARAAATYLSHCPMVLNILNNSAASHDNSLSLIFFKFSKSPVDTEPLSARSVNSFGSPLAGCFPRQYQNMTIALSACFLYHRINL